MKSKSRTAALGGGREGGYSQKEVFLSIHSLSFSLLDQFLLVSTFASNFPYKVWNWLYLEEDGGAVEGEEEEDEGAPERGVSVQFSPAEFLQVPSISNHHIIATCIPGNQPSSPPQPRGL